MVTNWPARGIVRGALTVQLDMSRPLPRPQFKQKERCSAFSASTLLSKSFFSCAALLGIWLYGPVAVAQQSAPEGQAQASLPDNPAPQQDPPSAQPQAPLSNKPQTKRILGIIPNFRSVSTDTKLPPQTLKEKFITTTEDSFDYSAVVIPTLLAGYNMGLKATPEFGQGAAGYGQYWWHSAVDQTTENYFVEFVFPVLTREDSRYYTLGRGDFFKRTGYALTRAVVTRSDTGSSQFNLSEVAGAGASAALANAYYPARERTFSTTATNWGLDVGIDAFTFVLKEFWPDVNQKWFHYDQPAQ